MPQRCFSVESKMREGTIIHTYVRVCVCLRVRVCVRLRVRLSVCMRSCVCVWMDVSVRVRPCGVCVCGSVLETDRKNGWTDRPSHSLSTPCD
ncbi:hypothetical protein EVAR_11796_1 [Eumeta japonica]|uniref:Uncharacterized protein n=1 Tax=Eumeta variegata TaxID=151549 RepID=A0A4C1UR63_EUMVA|nr:hypothetical protein EVAR_11796_1 [Eumeta japonica]